MAEIEEIKRRLRYDPLTGHIIWIAASSKLKTGSRVYKSWISRCLNKRAGHVYKKEKDKTSYRSLSFEGEQLKEHRLAVLFMTGNWPEGIVDHVDGDGTNNKWSNLRVVSNSESAKNLPLRKSNTSGVVGVNWKPRRIKWNSTIGVKYESIDLGHFEDFFEAVCARKSAENKHGFHENHGRT